MCYSIGDIHAECLAVVSHRFLLELSIVLPQVYSSIGIVGSGIEIGTSLPPSLQRTRIPVTKHQFSAHQQTGDLVVPSSSDLD